MNIGDLINKDKLNNFEVSTGVRKNSFDIFSSVLEKTENKIIKPDKKDDRFDQKDSKIKKINRIMKSKTKHIKIIKV